MRVAVAIVHVLLLAVFAAVPHAQAAQAPASPAQQLFFDAFEQWRQGRYDEAEALYRRGLEVEPGNARARLLLGDTLRDQKNLSGAQEAYREALRSGAPDVAQDARQRLSELPALPVARRAPPAKNPDEARKSLLQAAALLKRPVGADDIPVALDLSEGLAELGERAASLGILNGVTDAGMRLKDDKERAFGGLAAAHRDAAMYLARAAKDQWKSGDAQAAAQTLGRADAVARAIARLQGGRDDAQYAVTALAYVAMAFMAVGDSANANRAYNDALDRVNRADEGQRSGLRAKIAIIRYATGDVQGAWSMEEAVKERHLRFYVGHSWPEVMRSMAEAEADAGHYDKVVELLSRGDDDVGVSSSDAYLELVHKAIAQDRLDAAEALIPRMTSAEKRFEALSALALAYAARHRKSDVQRMLVRLREFGGGEVDAALPPLLLYVGQREEAEKRFAGVPAKLRSEALAALARGYALIGDYPKALQLAVGIPEDYKRSAALQAIAADCAITDLACALSVMKDRAFPPYGFSEVVMSRARAGDFETAAKLGAGIESVAPTAAGVEPRDTVLYLAFRELAGEASELGYCDEAMKYAKYAEQDIAFWTRVGRCAAGLPATSRESAR